MLSTEIYIRITLIILLLSILIEDGIAIRKINKKLNLKATLLQYFDNIFDIKMFDSKLDKLLIQTITIFENYFQ